MIATQTTTINATKAELVKELINQINEFHKELVDAGFLSGDSIFYKENQTDHLSIIDDLDYALINISNKEIELTTAFSGFHYWLREIKPCEWQLSFQGNWGGLNAQFLIVDLFKLKEDDTIISSSLLDGDMTFAEYSLLRMRISEVKMKKNIEWQEAMKIVIGCEPNGVEKEEEYYFHSFH